MVMNISCKFEKASYNIFFVRAVTVKSLYTLWRRRRRNKVKSIVSTGRYNNMEILSLVVFNTVLLQGNIFLACKTEQILHGFSLH